MCNWHVHRKYLIEAPKLHNNSWQTALCNRCPVQLGNEFPNNNNVCVFNHVGPIVNRSVSVPLSFCNFWKQCKDNLVATADSGFSHQAYFSRNVPHVHLAIKAHRCNLGVLQVPHRGAVPHKGSLGSDRNIICMNR